MVDKLYFTAAEVAAACGVSVTTIKRWVDVGVLPAHKTAGGHRRIPFAEVLRLARDGDLPQVDLRRLYGGREPGVADVPKVAERLGDALQRGDVGQVRGIIHGSYAAGMTVAALGDELVAPAMNRLGDGWEAGRIDVMHEHRATVLCTATLHELKAVVEAPAGRDRPLAVGGSPEGDPSLLASLLVQMVLLDNGWEAVNLGPNTPLASFHRAARELQPQLLWLSASYLPRPQAFVQEYRRQLTVVLDGGVAVAVGGRALDESIRQKIPFTRYGRDLRELAAFARQLHVRPAPPKRGRPPKEGERD